MRWVTTVVDSVRFLLTGSHPEPEHQQIQSTGNNDSVVMSNNDDIIYSNSNQVNTHVSTQVVSQPSNIICAANGKLLKYSLKRKQFHIMYNAVQAQIIEYDKEEFEFHLKVLDDTGREMFALKITNDLMIQFDEDKHSMVFALYMPKERKPNILSLVFQNGEEEIEIAFKSRMAMKLHEFNTKQIYAKLKEQHLPYNPSSLEMPYLALLNSANSDSNLQSLDENINLLKEKIELKKLLAIAEKKTAYSPVLQFSYFMNHSANCHGNAATIRRINRKKGVTYSKQKRKYFKIKLREPTFKSTKGRVLVQKCRFRNSFLWAKRKKNANAVEKKEPENATVMEENVVDESTAEDVSVEEMKMR